MRAEAVAGFGWVGLSWVVSVDCVVLCCSEWNLSGIFLSFLPVNFYVLIILQCAGRVWVWRRLPSCLDSVHVVRTRVEKK